MERGPSPPNWGASPTDQCGAGASAGTVGPGSLRLRPPPTTGAPTPWQPWGWAPQPPRPIPVWGWVPAWVRRCRGRLWQRRTQHLPPPGGVPSTHTGGSPARFPPPPRGTHTSRPQSPPNLWDPHVQAPLTPTHGTHTSDPHTPPTRGARGRIGVPHVERGCRLGPARTDGRTDGRTGGGGRGGGGPTGLAVGLPHVARRWVLGWGPTMGGRGWGHIWGGVEHIWGGWGKSRGGPEHIWGSGEHLERVRNIWGS